MQSTEPVKIEQPFNGDGNNIYYINGGRCSGKVNRTLNELVEYANNLQKQNQKYKEVIDKVSSQIKLYGKYDGEKCTRCFSMMTADFNKLLDILKEVE